MLILFGPSTVTGAEPTGPGTSLWVQHGPGGCFWSLADPNGNRIPDFSGVGYQAGVSEPPHVPVRRIVQPGPGDDTERIQQAIDALAAMPPDPQGFRGAVFLAAGEFQVAHQIQIRSSGIVLRGAGRGPNGTILRATGAGQRTVLLISGTGSPQLLPESIREILDPIVPVGAHAVTVSDPGGFSVGDRVLVRRIATESWIRDLGMDLLCCPPEVQPWSPSSYHIEMDRRITAIEGSTIFLDAPIACAIEQRHAGGTLGRYTWPGRIQNVGIEDLEGISDFTHPEDEDHAWTFIHLQAVEHAWVRRITARHFGFAAVSLGRGAKNVTVSDCSSFDPVSQITGGRRYAFVLDDAELCLVRNCSTRRDRHQFVTQSLTTGPNVFLDGLSESALADAGPHHRWATAALWDNIEVQGHDLNVQNRGNLGSGHGWAGANCVVWNCTARSFVVQNPPGARNWLVGSVGLIRSGTVYVGPHDPGTYDHHGRPVYPRSLYLAQRQNRLAIPRRIIREYWLGQPAIAGPDTHRPASHWADAAWRDRVQARAGADPLSGPDETRLRQWIPLTFRFSLDPDSAVYAAALHWCMRPLASNAAPPRLFLEQLEHDVSPSDWIRGPTDPTGSVVHLLDLHQHRNHLADGRLHVALQGDWSLDWAMLELHTGAALNPVRVHLAPQADAHVRDGPFATGTNPGSPLLTIQSGSTPGSRQRAFLLWRTDLLTPQIRDHLLSAWLKLTPVFADSQVEHALYLCTPSDWSESTLSWQTQPPMGPPFASWIPRTHQSVTLFATPQVQEALQTRQTLTLAIGALTNPPVHGPVSYASREHPYMQDRPWLILALPPAVIPRPRFRHVELAGDRLLLRGEDHLPGARYRVRFSTRPEAALEHWSSLQTNIFDSGPSFETSVPLPRNSTTGFFLLQLF